MLVSYDLYNLLKVLNGATGGFFLDNTDKHKEVNKRSFPKPNFKDSWWKQNGGITKKYKKNYTKKHIKKNTKVVKKTYRHNKKYNKNKRFQNKMK
tara:strand:+ start:1434 stop:1718 length:285 start_codon:yes stop_codon:yes gene_type:complete